METRAFEILKALKEVAPESKLGYSIIKQWVWEYTNVQPVVSNKHLLGRTLSVID